MKIRSILFALSLIALAHPALAQDVPQSSKQYTVSEEATRQNLLEPASASKSAPGLLEEQGYVWLSRHFQRLGPDAQGENRDSNRINMYMPMDLGGVEVRGYGQIFAPGRFYSMFSAVPNDTTGLMRNTSGDVINSVEYYEQFKDAGDFTIDTMQIFWFKNPNGGTPLAGATFTMFRSPAGVTDDSYLGSTAATGYQRRGARIGRTGLPIAYEAELSPEAIDTTIAGDFINPLVMGFDPPIAFTKDEFAMPFLINDEAEALANIGGANDIRDYQIMASWWSRRKGEVQGFGTNNGWKALGLTIFRPAGELETGKDTIYSLWSSIVFGQAPNQIPAHLETWMNFFGTVDLSAGVKYHYGREATSQGLGQPRPNPATADSRIPFSLVESSDVVIDLFDVSGTHVRSILNHHYVPGNYSVALPVGDLENGTYLVRMTTGENVYSMKVNVAK